LKHQSNVTSLRMRISTARAKKAPAITRPIFAKGSAKVQPAPF
jgi:hypothetical protein